MSENRGRFSWYELMTTDVDAAIDFYLGIADWGTTVWDEMPDYRMLTVGEAPVAGVMKLPDEAAAHGAPPHWLGYVHTPDIDATAAQAADLGANILARIDLPQVGRLAIISDPQAAVIAAFQPADEPGVEPATAPGRISWNELYTDDYEAAFAFYQALFGWEAMEDMDMGEAGIYRMYGRNGRTLGGMMNRPAEVPCCWLYYVNVADLDAAVAAVEAGGGTMFRGPMDVPGGDRVAHATDPQGGMFALHWSNPQATS